MKATDIMAQQMLSGQTVFKVSDSQYQAFLDLLARPAEDNAGLRELFSKPAPWSDTTEQAG